MFAGVLLAAFLSAPTPVTTLRAGDVVSIVETTDRARYVVRTADLRGGAVARHALACTLEEDRAGGCSWLSEVAVDETPSGGDPDGGLPTIVRKGAL